MIRVEEEPMTRSIRTSIVVLLMAAVAGAGGNVLAQRGALPPDQVARRLQLEREVHEIAVVDR
jgi:hypothetical protein